jgi:hypothetical protein
MTQQLALDLTVSTVPTLAESHMRRERTCVAVEAEIGHTFRKDLTLAQVKEAVEAGEQGAVGESWCC